MTESNIAAGKSLTARRLEKIPPYLFQRIDDMKAKAKAKGLKITSLGIGDPDLPTPSELVDELYAQAQINENQKYPDYKGLMDFKKAAAGYYKRRFDAELDPATEVLALIGSKEGIAHLALALLDPGDIVIVPDPGYPVYAMGAIFAGCESYDAPLLSKNDFLIDFKAIPDKICKRAKLLWMNYPNNPTGATAPVEFFEEAVAWAKKWGVVIAHDNPYAEIYTDLPLPPGLMSVKGGKEAGIEFYSLSKTFNMTGWRIGVVVGNAEIIDALGRVKSNIDSGIFTPIQRVGIKALNMDLSAIQPLRDIYKERRVAVEETLKAAGYEIFEGKGTFYVWVKTPNGMSSMEFVEEVLFKTGIIVGPGSGWGPSGEGYFRICLTRDTEVLREAVKIITDLIPVK